MKNLNTFNENRKLADGISLSEYGVEFYDSNPLSKTHDFFAFLYNDGFKEDGEGSGNYKKVIDIEKMHKVEREHVSDLQGMFLRARFSNQNVGLIWWPKEGSDMIDGKNSEEMDFYLIDLIMKHRSKKGTADYNIFDNIEKKMQNRSDARKKSKDFNL